LAGGARERTLILHWEFRALTGNDQFSEADIPDAIADVPQAPTVDTVVASSLVESSDSIRAAEKSVTRAKLGLIGPRFNLYPKLSAIAGATRDEYNRDINMYNKYQTDTWYVGAQVNWTMFDGFSTKGQKLAAYTRLRRAEQRLSGLRESMARGLERERQNVGFTWEAYQNAKMRLRMAREQVDHIQDLLKRGEASQAQVDAAQSAMNVQMLNTQSALAATSARMSSIFRRAGWILWANLRSSTNPCIPRCLSN
jgi:outer membrane protein TolC